MTTSPSRPAPSSSRSNGASGSSLPRWRSFLSTLNWRRDPGYEQRKMQHELRMKQLESEIAQSKERTKQSENEIEQLKKENARLAAIESRLVRFEQEHLSGSNPLSSTGDSSPL
jgi:septal ring factor EnvC (AmiA/AmiB activator)